MTKITVIRLNAKAFLLFLIKWKYPYAISDSAIKTGANETTVPSN